MRPSYVFNVRRNILNLQDNLLSRILENKQEEFFDVEPLFGRSEERNIENLGNVFDFFFV